jgi:uncharacterized repeat protein (TIGR02543 family)
MITSDSQETTIKHIVKVKCSVGGTMSVLYYCNGTSDVERLSNGGYANLQVDEGTTMTLTNMGPAASYTFYGWYIDGTSLGNDSVTETPRINTECEILAQYATDTYSKIIVKSEPESYGEAYITEVNSTVSLGTEVSSNQVYGNEVMIRANSRRPYVFNRWTEGGSIVPVTDGTTGARVSFSQNSDRIFIAHFSQPNTMNIRAFSSTTSGGEIVPRSGSGSFEADYIDSSGNAQHSEFNSLPTDFTIRTNGYQGTVNLSAAASSIYTENGAKFKYTIEGFYYTMGIYEQSQQANWVQIPGTQSGTNYIAEWTTSEISSGSGFTITAAFNRNQAFQLSTEIVVTNNPSVTPTGISVSGSGLYSNGESVQLSATISNQKYEFDGWYLGETLVSTSRTYTVNAPGAEVTYTAKFTERCRVSYGMGGGGISSGVEITCTDVSGSSTVGNEVPSGSFVDHGSSIRFTLSGSTQGKTFSWIENNRNITPQSPTEYTVTVVRDEDVKVNVMESSQEIKVFINGSGTIDLMQSQDGSAWESIGSFHENGYAVIETGSYLRSVAHPGTRHQFASYVLEVGQSQSHQGTVETSTNPDTIFDREIDTDAGITATFTFVPWINTIGSIIKVY